ncbi:MAG: histidine--tRNA ligase, partial [Odoribacter sp.]|nr:histidine--tRNA ligase [Odoribacter sp.]
SGVGISFGADRIFDVMNQLDLFPKDNTTTTQLLFANFGTREERHCLALLKELRAAGINAEIYPEAAKMKKQMAYADKKGIPFVALVGENEMAAGTVSLKNMRTGEQTDVPAAQLREYIK